MAQTDARAERTIGEIQACPPIEETDNLCSVFHDIVSDRYVLLSGNQAAYS